MTQNQIKKFFNVNTLLTLAIIIIALIALIYQARSHSILVKDLNLKVQDIQNLVEKLELEKLERLTTQSDIYSNQIGISRGMLLNSRNERQIRNDYITTLVASNLVTLDLIKSTETKELTKNENELLNATYDVNIALSQVLIISDIWQMKLQELHEKSNEITTEIKDKDKNKYDIAAKLDKHNQWLTAETFKLVGQFNENIKIPLKNYDEKKRILRELLAEKFKAKNN